MQRPGGRTIPSGKGIPGGKTNPVPPPLLPPPPGEGVGVGVGVGVGDGGGVGRGKLRKPPRNIKEVLVEIPVPGWPMLVLKLKPEEVAPLPPTSITPDSIVKFVDVAESAKTKNGAIREKIPIAAKK
ncbi:MAG: hypothetical protein Q7R94_02940 [bacterium]|nr:hypothetical protein [bacterium]